MARRQPSAFLLAAQLLSLLRFPPMDDTSGGRNRDGRCHPARLARPRAGDVEQFAGVGYIATVVSGLIGLGIARAR